MTSVTGQRIASECHKSDIDIKKDKDMYVRVWTGYGLFAPYNSFFGDRT